MINFVLIHGFRGSPTSDYHMYLKLRLESRGFSVSVPELPNSKTPNETEQIESLLSQATIDESTIIVAHSLGAAVAIKSIMAHGLKVLGLVLVAPVMEERFCDPERLKLAYWQGFDISYDYDLIRRSATHRIVVSDNLEKEVRGEYCRYLAKNIDAELTEVTASRAHITGYEEPLMLEIIDNLLTKVDLRNHR